MNRLRWIVGSVGAALLVTWTLRPPFETPVFGSGRVSMVAPASEDKGRSTDSKMAQRAKEDPVAFLTECLARYDREVKGYRAIMQKQERIGGRLQPKEIINVCFKDKPHSVLLVWMEGARKAERALYVEGENNGKMLARPNGFIARKVAGDVVERDVDGADARQSGRYPLNEYGIKKGTERTLAAWSAARDQRALHVEFLGEQRVREAGDRFCYKLRRRNARPENDGVTELTIYVDKENLLQVGSILKGPGGKLIGEYFFRDIELNPAFSEGQFERGALSP
jgi:Protein of unknown function (DUF1571)